MELAHDQVDGPVTVIVTRTAKKGRIKEFEDWMDGIVHESLKFEGHMGVNIIRPVDQSRPEYVIIFHFNTLDNLLKWEKSQARKEWLEKSKNVVEREDKVQKLSGLEFWFTPRSTNTFKRGADNNNEDSSMSVTVPPRYKMAIITAGIVFVLLNTLIPQIEQLTTPLPLLLSSLLGVLIMVLLMTYLIMPSITRLLKPWLYRKKFV
jgi:antibiotic biosynthesis monooxygenase (ABM) superfamily enzyme